MISTRTSVFQFTFNGSHSVSSCNHHIIYVWGVPKMCLGFNRMPFPQFLTEPIVLTAPCSQHLLILIDKNSSQTLQRFSHQRKNLKLSYFGTRENCSQDLDSAASVVWNIVIFWDVLISRNVSRFDTTSTISSTHNISDDRPASVANTRRPSMTHGNPPFSDTISPSVCAFSLVVKCGWCVDICCEVKHRLLEVSS